MSPIISSELVKYSSANRPENDTSTGGGAIATTHQPVFTQLSGTKTIRVRSDGADTRTVTLTGRSTAGAIVSEPLVLNGTTAVNGAQQFERLLKIELSASDATRTVTIETNEGTPEAIATIGPNQTGRHIMFYNAASQASPVTRYDKEHWRNEDPTLSLLGAQVTLTADPAARIRIGLATAVNDAVTIADRLTAPGGVTFVDDGVAANVPGTDLAASASIGVWIEQTLPANHPPEKSTYTTRLAGTTA